MSLVDYASSSDEDETEKLEQRAGDVLEKRQRVNDASSRQEINRKETSLPTIHMKSVSNPSGSSELKLPDASFLLNSPSVPSNGLNASDHSSRVAAAMAQSAARKRELNMLPADGPRSKFPKGSLPHSKNVPDTLGGRLLPPQLVGSWLVSPLHMIFGTPTDENIFTGTRVEFCRSNVVTEDISKLFVRRSSNSSTE